ncbi:uncharacterized protein FFB20_07778 [Fusarium fujikuroi]|uniref:Uncharacterized protein n=2 Tax=Fusarium fujikuroi TaxID=5127 RepID=S0DSV2_GIBF5|nr:uncharacterized protein FFUJ_02604 [Fusarium fujikuroi IMI 58289]QGI61814.1 hypothetical protein CEK27_005785 [Fusarium fujikuroi]QGI78997.1 hypothetical protein CEK25_005726 [Fusarium fujikuroi]QGI92712.1 hypothetical protein CEK26_005781 [Fusarium fujikuroi]CCT65644.1 uncharacterized protein FFUJ_02604 [Fusarium fujikuroi IMI 58289]SCN76167.1 uncharacterized protein FFE2_03411 [Fusarium fujikuroi]
MSESRPAFSIRAIAPTDDGNLTWKESKTKLTATVRNQLQIHIFKLPTSYNNMCPEAHQRAISGSEQLQECPEYNQGIECETTNEYFTEYVSADQCEVCEMRRIEAEAAAAAEEEAKKANAT